MALMEAMKKDQSRALFVYIIYSIVLAPSGFLAFNLDLSSAVTHHGQAGSMFGFTVLQYSHQGKQLLLVGAPEAQTDQPDVTKGGAVFKCSITQQDVCEQVVFDAKGPNTAWNAQTRLQEAYDDKSHQWFGATLTTSGPDGAVAACAPRYVYFSPNFAKREPVGTCYVATQSLTNFQERSPCRSGSGSSGYHQQGSCQAGFSGAISRDGSRMYMGAPGTWYWQGQMHSTSMKEPEDLLSTVEGPPSADDSYLGYSTVVGQFNADRQDDVAVGMPRGANLTGAVILFDRQLRNLLNLSGEQMGSYFGYSLAVGDINNDKLDDLIVGAPLFTNFSANDNSFEKGRVYVFYQKASHQFSRPDVLDGEFNRGRLGMSVASVGDLNLDGYGDIAAGAPYAGEEAKGIVYIYMGSRNGIITKAMQSISASDLNFQLSTFGFSLSGGADLDANQYPDLVVGAYKSDRAVILKSRPVIVATVLLDMPTTINLEQKGNCILKNGTQVSCFVLNTFVSYTGINVPDRLAIEVETILDSGAHVARAFFRNEEGQSGMNKTFDLAKNQQLNSSVYVYIPNQFRDKLNPIKMEAKYRILENAALSRQRRDTRPVLDQMNSTSVIKQIRIGNKCGSDNICYPALRVSARESSGLREYVLGKSEPITIDVEVANEGEDAFETMFFLNLPAGINYVKIQPQAGQQNVAVTCTHRGSKDENVVICDIANPLATAKNAKFTVFLAPIVSQLTLDALNFTAKVNSSNPERVEEQRNNQVDFRLPIFAEAELIVIPASFPEQVRYCVDCTSPSKYTEEWQIGPQVKHVYSIYNHGPSTMETGQVRIIWPSYTRNHMHLLYLIEEPHVEGNAKCSKVPTNLANVAIELNETLQYYPMGQKTGFSTVSLGAGSARRQRAVDSLIALDEEFEEHFSQSSREKRQAASSDSARLQWTDPQKACGAAECTFITCDIGRLMERERVVITIRSRLWEESLRTLQFSDIGISSTALVHVQTLSHGIRPRSNQYTSKVIKTEVVPSNPAQVKATFEWWMILVGVLLGLLMLVLIILACWKCGYFKRKRPGVAGAGGGRSPAPGSTNGRNTAAANNGNTPYYAYRYDYADNKYYPERAPGKHSKVEAVVRPWRHINVGTEV